MEDVEDLDDLFKEGYKYYWEGDYKTAYQFFDKSIKKEGEFYLKTYYKALSLNYQGKLTKSLPLFKKTLDQRQDFIECLVTLATVYQKLGKNENALQVLNDALDKHPTIDERFEIIQNKTKIFDSLKKQNRKVNFPNDFEEGMWNYIKGYHPDAIGYFDDYLADNPRDYVALLYSAISRCNNNEHIRALENINKCIEVEPNYGKVWYIKAKILERKGDYQLAIESCEKALKLNPKSVLFSDYLSNLYRKKSKFKSAAPKVDKSLVVTPRVDTIPDRNREKELPPLFGISMAIYTSKIYVLGKGKDVNSLISALKYFGVKDYIALQIDFMSMYYGITNQIKINETLKETIELAAKFMGFTRKDPEAFDIFNKALEYITKSKIAKGLGLMEKAIELCPNNPIYAAEIYKIHQQVGNIKKAIDIRKNFEDKISQFQSKEYQQKEFDRLNKSVDNEINHCNDLKKSYVTFTKPEKGILDFLNETISEIAKFLEGDSKTVNKNNLSKIVEDCLFCLELISHVASLSFFKLKMNLGDAQFDNKIKARIIDILGWEPEPLPHAQTPNFLSPSLRKENWFTTLGMDVLSGMMMNSIQEARYRHIDGNETNDDSKTHMWYSKVIADQANIVEQHKLHDRVERELITKHIEDHFGKNFKVIHSKKSFPVHIDIYIIPPTKERRYGLLITSGMSELPMNPPPDVWKWWKIDISKIPKEARKALNCDYAELVIKLPPDWPLPSEELKKDDYFWPIEELHNLINYVHNDKQWFWDGHTFGGESGTTTFAKNTKLSGWLFMFPSLFLPPQFPMLKISPSKLICFLQLIPLYSEEVVFALKNGKPALLKKLDEFKIKDHIDINRLNVCKTRETNN